MSDIFDISDLPSDWFLLLLRLLFIALLYFFLYQLFRVQSRELMALAAVSQHHEEAPPYRLVVEDGGESLALIGRTFQLKPFTTIGRHQSCVIALDEPFLSGHHAEIRYADGRWWVQDLGSTNGTFINGTPIQGPTDIEPGDVVQFGRVKLRLVA
jgi:hypothetical protein